jgi:hypothetical protein
MTEKEATAKGRGAERKHIGRTAEERGGLASSPHPSAGPRRDGGPAWWPSRAVHRTEDEVGGWSGCREGGGGFQLHGAGKEDVAFEVGVLAEVVFEFLEAGIEDAVGEADAEGWGVVMAELADVREAGSGFLVVVGEDGDGFR